MFNFTKSPDRPWAKKIGLILAFCMLLTSLPQGNMVLSAKAEGESGRDVSKSADISFELTNFIYTLTSGESKKMNAAPGANGATDYSFEHGISVASINEFGFTLKFSIVDCDLRTIKGGDFFKIAVPEGVLLQDKFEKEFSSSDGEVFLRAEYKDGYLVCTFEDAINSDMALDGVSGGLGLSYKLDNSKLSDTEEKTVTIVPEIGNIKASNLVLPMNSKEVSGVTKTGFVNKDDNTVAWTVTVGSDPVSLGNSLKDVTVTDYFNPAELEFISAEINGTAVDVTTSAGIGGKVEVSYTFPDDSVVAPCDVIFNTKITETVLKNAIRDMVASGADTFVINGAKISGGNVNTPSDTSAIATVPALGINKMGEQIDANTVEWTLILNDKHSNVYKATVIDNLSEHLSIDDSYGVNVTLRNEDGTDSNNTVMLNSVNTSADLLGKNILLTASHSAVSLYVKFNTPFTESYKIVFRTKVDKDFANNSQAVNGNTKNEIKNRAYVDVEFPNGIGPGEYVHYEGTEVITDFLTAYVKIIGTGANSKTGKLNWEVMPSSKTDFDTATLTIIADTTDQDFEDGSVSLVTTSGNVLDVAAAKYEVTTDASGKHIITATFKKSELDNLNVVLSDMRLRYSTIAKSFFATDEKHEYEQKADLVVVDALDSTKTYETSSKDTQTLTNTVVEKYGEVIFDDVKRDAYFHFTIITNRNGVTYNNLTITDDLSTAIRVKSTDAPIDPSYFDLMDKTAETSAALAKSRFESYVSYLDADENEQYVGGASELSIYGTTKVVKYESAVPTDKTIVLHIFVKLNDKGKKAFGISGNHDETIIANNTVKVAAAELSKVFTANFVSKDNTDSIDTKQLSKGAEQLAGDDECVLEWHLDVNSSYMDNSLGGSDVIQIVDKIPKGLSLDKKSIKFVGIKHETVSGAGITVVSDGAVTSISSDTSNNMYFATSKNEDGTTTLTVTIKSTANVPYGRIIYDTIMVDGAGEFTNEAVLSAGGKTSVSKKKYQAKNFSWATGGRRVVFWFYKADSLSDSSNIIPLKGAKYALYDNASCTGEPVDEAYSDASGKVFLMGNLKDDSNNFIKYYIKETGLTTELSKDYKMDNTIYGPYEAKKGGKTKISPVVSGTKLSYSFFINKRKTENALADAYIKKHFASETNGINVSGLSSEFALYVYPKTGHGEDTYSLGFAKKLNVRETGLGEYEFVDTREDQTGLVSTLKFKSVSDANGDALLEIKGLPWGTYGLVETKTADGFILKKEPTIFKVVAGVSGAVCEYDTTTAKNKFDAVETVGSFEYGVINNNQTKVTIKKADEIGNELTDYSKVSYEVKPETGKTFADGSDTAVVISRDDLKGYVIFGKCIAGVNYFVRETSLPDGYLKSADFSFNIDKNTGALSLSKNAPAVLNSDKTEITVKEKVTGVSFVKVDQNGNGVAGAELSLTGVFAKAGDATLSWVSAVDASGKPVKHDIKGELICGNEYVLTESFSPEGYITPTAGTGIKIKLSSDGVVSMVSNGDASFHGTVKDSVLTVRNLKVETDVTFKKVDAIDGAGLKDAVFELYNKADNSKIGEYTSASNGAVTIKNLAYGEYKLVEKTAPNHYVPDTTPIEFSVTNGSISVNGSDYTVNPLVLSDFANQRKPASIKLTKRDDEDSTILLSGATYELYEKAGDVLVDTQTTDANGNLVFDNLSWYKQYYVKEISAPAGYRVRSGIINGVYKEFTRDLNMTDEQMTLLTTDERIKASLKITKVDADDNSITVSGAAYSVTKNGSQLVGTFTTGDEGTVTVPNLGKGSYTVVEETAPIGYALNKTDVYTFTVTDNDDLKVFENTFANKKTLVDLVTAVDVGNKVNGATKTAIEGLGNVVIGVYRDEALTNFVTNLTSEPNGQLSFKGLNEGTYYIKETGTVSENVELTNEVFKLDTSDNSKLYKKEGGLWVEIAEKKIVNKIYRSNFNFTKVDAADNTISVPESRYGIYLKKETIKKMTDGDAAVLDPTDVWELAGETVSDASGAVSFTGLNAGGTYKIMELEAPVGYQLSKNAVKLSVKRTAMTTSAHIFDDGSSTVTADAITGNLIWNEPRLNLSIEKKDENGARIAGAELSLIDKLTGNVLESWVSDGLNAHVIDTRTLGIKGGKEYILREDKEPEGYTKAADITFRAETKPLAPSETDYIQVITMVDRKYVAPSAGIITLPKNDEKEAEETEEAGDEEGTGENAGKPKNPHKQPTSPVNITDKKSVSGERDERDGKNGDGANSGVITDGKKRSPKTGHESNALINLLLKLF